jgi:hypothetical protein
MADMRNIIDVIDGSRDVKGLLRFLMHGW